LACGAQQNDLSRQIVGQKNKKPILQAAFWLLNAQSQYGL